MSKYKELVDLLEELGILQFDEEWAVQIQQLIKEQKERKSSKS